MSLFNQEQVVETNEVKLTKHVNGIKKMNSALLAMMKQLHAQAYEQVWNSEFDTQHILDAFDTDAKSLFELSSGVQTIIKSADDSYEVLLPTSEVTLNEDGTVTLK